MGQISSPQHTNAVITVASWEERFLRGMNQIMDTIAPSRILMFHYKEYSDWSNAYRVQVSKICEQKGIELKKDKELSFVSPLESWRTLVAEVKEVIAPGESITLDITTMPRETLWSICHVFEPYHINVQYIYHRPDKYGDWLSRDPGKPRILYKQAGIQYLGRSIVLAVQTGYDIERVKQLETFFEPDKVLLGLQIGDQFRNSKQNRQKHEEAFSTRRDIELFDVNGFSLESTYQGFTKKITPLLDNYNIILSSLGPKVGALALYKIKQDYPDVALCYAPSNEFNREYSSGVGDGIHGILNTKV